MREMPRMWVVLSNWLLSTIPFYNKKQTLLLPAGLWSSGNTCLRLWLKSEEMEPLINIVTTNLRASRNATLNIKTFDDFSLQMKHDRLRVVLSTSCKLRIFPLTIMIIIIIMHVVVMMLSCITARDKKRQISAPFRGLLRVYFIGFIDWRVPSRQPLRQLR